MNELDEFRLMWIIQKNLSEIRGFVNGAPWWMYGELQQRPFTTTV